LPKLHQTCPNSFCATIFSRKDYENFFWDELQKNKKRSSCVSANVGRHFFKSNKVEHQFFPNFQRFCPDFATIFWDFAPIFTDFAQILRDFARVFD